MTRARVGREKIVLEASIPSAPQYYLVLVPLHDHLHGHACSGGPCVCGLRGRGGSHSTRVGVYSYLVLRSRLIRLLTSEDTRPLHLSCTRRKRSKEQKHSWSFAPFQLPGPQCLFCHASCVHNWCRNSCHALGHLSVQLKLS